MKRMLVWLLLTTGCAAPALLASPAFADVVELKTGQRVEGSLKQATSSQVSIEVGGQEITFPVDRVRAIYFGAPLPPALLQPSLRGEALRALKGLQSAVGGAGLTYREYTPRVTDAKIVVDRYLDEAKDGSDSARAAVSASMRYYSLAARAWYARVAPFGSVEFAPLAADPVLAECPAAMAALAEGRKKSKTPGAHSDGVSIAFNVPVLWSCAADKIGEAEKLEGERK